MSAPHEQPQQESQPQQADQAQPAQAAGAQQPQQPQQRTFVPRRGGRIRGGLTPGADFLSSAKETEEQSGAWAGVRWLRVVERVAPAQAYAEGLDLARRGGVRTLEFHAGRVEARVRAPGLSERVVTVSVSRFTPEQWDAAVEAMSEQAAYAAKLLAGELPTNIEDVFLPLGLRLFPAEGGDFSPQTPGAGGSNEWDTLTCAAGVLAADRLHRDPFQIFVLRGLDPRDLLDRLKQRRSDLAAASRRGASAPLPLIGTASLEGQGSLPLESDLDRFWQVGSGLGGVDTTPRAPKVKHAILRRLGPSPWGKGGFPLIGLLASCYEAVSGAALEERSGDGEGEGEVGEAD